MNKKNWKKLLIFCILAGSFLAVHLAFAQDLGLNAVNNGLSGSLSSEDPRTLVGRIINIALGFLGVVAIGFISYAGFLWMTSNGEEEKVEKAKKILRNWSIGLAIILCSWAIATFIISKLGGATGTSGTGCTDGEIASCGCGGQMTCSGGSFGSCVGSDCTHGGNPTNCDANLVAPGCQAVNQKCASTDYCDSNDCGCKPKGGLGDPCNIDAGSATCNPDNNRCGEYLTCNPQSCTCFGSPVITEISPAGGFCNEDVNKSCTADKDCTTTCNMVAPNGSRNNFISIFGKNFGVYSATSSKVVFLGNNNPQDGIEPASLNAACINTWRDDQIVIAVPSASSTGPIRVINSDNLADDSNDTRGPALPDFQVNNISRPGLCYLNPNRGILSSEVGYQGINLYSGHAFFGNYENNVSGLNSQFTNPAGLTGTSTTPNIQSGDSGSFVQNNYNGHQEKSNYLKFIKEPEAGEGPFISSFSPVSGNVGQYVTIRGNGFGGARGTNKVYIGDIEATYDFPDLCLNSVWKDKQIIVKVPAGLADGDHTIKIVLGDKTIDTQKINPNSFHFDKNLALKTSLCKIEPERGPVGTPVSLWGEYFGQAGRSALVKFNYNKTATGTIEKDGRADLVKTAVPIGSISGPVRVINNSDWGNELNFAVGECKVDADCGLQVCCPSNTYKKGRCASSLAQCYIDIPTSVFEWNFSTGFGSTTPNPFAYSCAGLARYNGACQSGAMCPNVPGTCSPYLGGNKKVVGDCDFSCASVAGCNSFGPNNCSYNSKLDKCVKNGIGSSCNLPEVTTYVTVDGLKATTTKVCNNKHWEIKFKSTCPVGWSKGTVTGVCIQDKVVCDNCSSDFNCEKNPSGDTKGICASNKICASGGVCEANYNGGGADKCVTTDQASCDCCCQIGQDARDCCAPLKCEGSCGSGAGLGKCGGCKSAGNTPELRDAACNCTGHSGQFCDINNPSFPDGVCTDCSNLTASDCSNHSSSCCIDAVKTATTTDDICRGGNGQLISNSSSSPSFGFCAYFKCQSPLTGDPTKCASTSPVVVGDYASTEECVNDCAKADPCSGIKTLEECQNHSRCCFDAEIPVTASSSPCRLGDKIPEGNLDSGYCAYYDCKKTGNGKECATSTPVKSGTYKYVDSCIRYCATPPTGPGLSCDGQATSTCVSTKCNFPGFGCFLENGGLGTVSPSCGTCCCQPGPNDVCAEFNPKLKCLADKGSCTGGSRGLCCGCSSDNECGSVATVGCGSDTCCEARPEIVSTAPAHLADKICRNSVITVNFNKTLDSSSLNSNILLLEERDYGNGVCPSGTFITQADTLFNQSVSSPGNWFVAISKKIAGLFAKLTGHLAGQASADLPNPNKLYCQIPGRISGTDSGNKTSVIFAPQKILSAGTNYYLVVKGDENLDSKTGILSASEVGFNGLGYYDPTTKKYVAGETIKFNNHSYANSQIFKFSTLSDQSPMAGVCAIDSVQINPKSYLFNKTENDLNENDNDPQAKTFDTAADRDKVFSAFALSADGQVLQPVSGYFWDWNFQLSDPSVATIQTVGGLEKNRAFIEAKSGVTDSETNLIARLSMQRFAPGGNCHSGSCVCQDSNCSNNCCNAYFGGDGFNKSSDIHIFVCNNPWPPVNSDGEWSPWSDNCQGNTGGACQNYSYKFYYCRDNGSSGTQDDLPAIISQPIIKGASNNKACSVDDSPCTNLGETCGPDNNADGIKDGICFWKVLKESYFFREAVLSGGELISAADTRLGGKVSVSWRSKSDQVGSYKIYYLKSGQGNMMSREVTPASACTQSGGLYICQNTISGLDNDVSYVFKVSVISANRTESGLSSEKTVTPTDKTAPSAPTGLKAEVIASSSIKFSWSANSADTSFYRLYHGINPGRYGESFDSAKSTASLSFPLNQFPANANYFALSALDSYKNESSKSGEMACNLTLNKGCNNFNTPGCLNLNCCTRSCAFKCGGASDGCGGTCNNSCPGNQPCVDGSCLYGTGEVRNE